MIDLCTLGTGGALPLPERGLASLYVRMNGRGLLIDCGEATQTAIRRLGWGFRSIDGVFITHFHGDHCGGLPGFLLSMAKTGREEPLHIWGGPGLARIVDGLCVIVPHLPYPLLLHESSAEGFAFDTIGLHAEAFPLDHGLPCLGLTLELKRAGAFLPDKARALGVPVALWKALQSGNPVTFDDKRVQPADVLGPARAGLKLVYATDTRPVERIAEAGRGSDLMILEGMYGDDSKMPQALRNRHMLFREAAALAAQAETKKLLLTHFSNSVDDPDEYLPNARAVFAETYTAHDLDILSLGYTDAGKK